MRRLALVAAAIVLLVARALALAQDAPPAASPGAAPAADVLLDAAIGALPAGRQRVQVERWTLRPSPTPLTLLALGGPVAVAVESGAVTAAVGGAERRLAAGESLLLAGDDGAAFRAAGPAEAVAVFAYLVPPRLEWFENYDQLLYASDTVVATSGDLPGGPGRLALERLTLPPGTALPPLEAHALSWVGIATGTLGLALDGDRLPLRWESGVERALRHGQPLPGVAPGTTMTLRNAGEDALVLYRLTVTPAARTALAAGTPGDGTPAP
jgi:hypothetical protein